MVSLTVSAIVAHVSIPSDYQVMPPLISSYILHFKAALDIAAFVVKWAKMQNDLGNPISCIVF